MHKLEDIMQLDIDYINEFSEMERCPEGVFFTIRKCLCTMTPTMHIYGRE